MYGRLLDSLGLPHRMSEQYAGNTPGNLFKIEHAVDLAVPVAGVTIGVVVNTALHCELGYRLNLANRYYITAPQRTWMP